MPGFVSILTNNIPVTIWRGRLNNKALILMNWTGGNDTVSFSDFAYSYLYWYIIELFHSTVIVQLYINIYVNLHPVYIYKY